MHIKINLLHLFFYYGKLIANPCLLCWHCFCAHSYWKREWNKKRCIL